MSKFELPDFDNRQIEVRMGAEGVAIYGTKQGLLTLAELCQQLARRVSEKSNEHVHLEDYEILTKASLPLVVSCLNQP